MLTSLLATLTAKAIVSAAHLVTAVRAEWDGCEPRPAKRIYFANHASHADFVLIWTVLPPQMRKETRAVAAGDYWLKSPVRRFLIQDVFNAITIERDAEKRTQDPVEQMSDALDDGASLILFPEGTRNVTDQRLLPFKSGLYHLAAARPDIDLVPVWIENLGRVMPKGEFLPVPVACSVKFGQPIHLGEGEDKESFLTRASTALIDLTEPEQGSAS